MVDRWERYYVTMVLAAFVAVMSVAELGALMIGESVRGYMPERKPKLKLLQGGKK